MSAYRIPKAALAFRIFHAAIAFEQLFAIGYVWWCALSGRRGRLLRIAATSLIGEGVLVAANRGDCPLGPLQKRLGDPVPLFELVLSPRAAKRAVPTLGAVAAGGLLLLVMQSPRRSATRLDWRGRARSATAEAWRWRPSSRGSRWRDRGFHSTGVGHAPSSSIIPSFVAYFDQQDGPC